MIFGRSGVSGIAFMVPGEGFEPPTFGLQNRCTATVLTRLFAAPLASARETPLYRIAEPDVEAA